MMPLSYILWKYTDGYQRFKSLEKINPLMYFDDIKLFAKSDKEMEALLQALRIYSWDIEMEFGIEKCAMLIMRSGKRQKE